MTMRSPTDKSQGLPWSECSPSLDSGERVEPTDDETDDVDDVVMTACPDCEGSGQVTLDAFETPLPALIREIEKDERDGSTSRTRQALRFGHTKLTDCDACGGSGLVPTPIR